MNEEKWRMFERHHFLTIYFIRHVVQGGPVPNHLNRGVNLRKPFVDAELTSVTFQEYHKDFPHKKYTLGYGAYEYEYEIFLMVHSLYN